MTDARWEREMQLLVREVLGWRTRPALAGLGMLNDLYLPWLERRLVLRARREGVSWTGIGRLLGRSRQAIRQRHDIAAHVGWCRGEPVLGRFGRRGPTERP